MKKGLDDLNTIGLYRYPAWSVYWYKIPSTFNHFFSNNYPNRQRQLWISAKKCINFSKYYKGSYELMPLLVRGDKMDAVLTLGLIAIAGIGGGLAYMVLGPKIRQRYHNDTLRTRSA